MHLPLIWMVPSASIVQACSGLPLQSEITIGVSFLVALPRSSTHLVWRHPETIGPVTGPLEAAGVLADAACGTSASAPIQAVIESRAAGITDRRRSARPADIVPVDIVESPFFVVSLSREIVLLLVITCLL